MRDGGRFDGRLGILLPIAVIGDLHRRGERLPYHLEIVAFAEKEGVRFKSSFLASSALAVPSIWRCRIEPMPTA